MSFWVSRGKEKNGAPTKAETTAGGHQEYGHSQTGMADILRELT